MAAGGALKAASARVCACLAVPLCMYGRVQIVMVFYGSEELKYEGRGEEYVSHAAAKRIADITLARYCLQGTAG